MAIFSNQATLTYNGSSTNSNIAYGELLEVLTATKTAVEGSYTAGNYVTYVVTLRNSGASALTGLSLTDDLGGYSFNGTTVYPLTYRENSLRLFVNGALQTTPTVTAGPPLTVSGVSVPAGGCAVMVYQALVNDYASPESGSSIVNTVTVSGGGLSASVTATETVLASALPRLSISKSISPGQVTGNDRVTYTFLIQNSGNTAVSATDGAVITDLFDPILSDLTVTWNEAAWTQGREYTYDATTGQFATVAGQITVPAATYTQDATTGQYTVTPGTAILTVTGTI